MANYLKKYKFFRSFHKNKPTYEEAEILRESYKTVIACKKCGQKLRVPISENKKLRIACSKCKYEFAFDCKLYRRRKKILSWTLRSMLLVLLVADIVVPLYLYPKVNSITDKFKNKYDAEIKETQSKFLEEKKKLQEKYTEEIRGISPAQFKINADDYYRKIWEERKNYSSKFAITPREKAQLEMMALSKDKTKRIEDIIKGIAFKAAPRNSMINVYASGNGYKLDIDFDMSELSSGEEGTRTKHQSIDSLRKDVVRLISKVTKDVYQFCQNLDLESISIGCRHYVRQYDEYKTYRGEVNSILYKIRVDRIDLLDLKNNPFLDTYSTTKCFKVEEDNFPNIEISTREPK